jgi:hypothetical protein
MRKTPVKKRNPQRQARELKRTYHSKQRKLWISAHHCVACGAFPSVNAHTRHPDSGGSYKGPYSAIVPLCIRCEREKHDHGEDTFNVKYSVQLHGHTLAAHAARIAQEWEQHEWEAR